MQDCYVSTLLLLANRAGFGLDFRRLKIHRAAVDQARDDNGGIKTCQEDPALNAMRKFR